MARQEALEHLGDDAGRFVAAVSRYVNAVELADQARRSWLDAGRPIVVTFKNGMTGQDARLAVMERLEAAAAKLGASLGLDPMSARKLGRIGRPGRPMGAASAPDQVAPLLLATQDGVQRVEPPRVTRRSEK